MVKIIMNQQYHNQLDYISKQNNKYLFDILNKINEEIDKNYDILLVLVKKKIELIIKIRTDK